MYYLYIFYIDISKLGCPVGQVNSVDPEDLADPTDLRKRGMNFAKSPRNPKSAE